jgi:hypothetical protein
MPRIQRHDLPPALFQHLLERIHSRDIPGDQLGLLSDWLLTDSEVPAGRWFKTFPQMTVCGEGHLIKPFSNLDRSRMARRHGK